MTFAGKAEPDARDVVLAVHGGADSALVRERTAPETERAYRDGLERALRAGREALGRGAGSVPAVEAAVRELEDEPLFNAGRGSVLTSDEGFELDASVMRGSDLAAGAVACVRHVRNPVTAARLVMERSPHVLLAGRGADAFAEAQGLEPVAQSHFWTRHRRDQLLSVKGTVGAVAVDPHGELAAATSTGGTTGQAPGRVGDSPLIGAGTYAKNGVVAASATGDGEIFIRGAATATIAGLMEFGGLGVAEAAYEVLMERLPGLGGSGGVIALDPAGVFAAPHSSEGMLHGYAMSDGTLKTCLYTKEPLP